MNIKYYQMVSQSQINNGLIFSLNKYDNHYFNTGNSNHNTGLFSTKSHIEITPDFILLCPINMVYLLEVVSVEHKV